MSPHDIFTALEALAWRLGIEVRKEPLPRPLGPTHVPGGVCRIRDRTVILLDATAPLCERSGTLARALSTLDLEGIYLAPAVRAAIVARGSPMVQSHHQRPRPLARTKPSI